MASGRRLPLLFVPTQMEDWNSVGSSSTRSQHDAHAAQATWRESNRETIPLGLQDSRSFRGESLTRGSDESIETRRLGRRETIKIVSIVTIIVVVVGRSICASGAAFAV